MNEYHKIQTVFKRDPNTKFKTLLEGEYSLQEFEYLKDCEWIFTEKVDGTNIRVMWDGKDVTFGGKSDNAQIPAYLITRLNNLFMSTPKRKMFEDSFEDGVCLYGEGFGAKIQKGGGNYISDGQDFCLFDVRIGNWWLKREDVESIGRQFGLQIVPIIMHGNLTSMVNFVKKGFKSLWGDFDAEGIVARPLVEFQTRDGSRIITKLKCKDFNKGLNNAKSN